MYSAHADCLIHLKISCTQKKGKISLQFMTIKKHQHFFQVHIPSLMSLFTFYSHGSYESESSD